MGGWSAVGAASGFEPVAGAENVLVALAAGAELAIWLMPACEALSVVWGCWV